MNSEPDSGDSKDPPPSSAVGDLLLLGLGLVWVVAVGWLILQALDFLGVGRG